MSSQLELDRIYDAAFGWAEQRAAFLGADATDTDKRVALRSARTAILANQGDGEEDEAFEEGYNEGWSQGLAIATGDE